MSVARIIRQSIGRAVDGDPRRPTASQPGTLAQQLLAIDLYLDSQPELRLRHPRAAWHVARQTARREGTR